MRKLRINILSFFVLSAFFCRIFAPAFPSHSFRTTLPLPSPDILLRSGIEIPPRLC